MAFCSFNTSTLPSVHVRRPPPVHSLQKQMYIKKTWLLFFYYLTLEVLSTFNIVLWLYVDKLTVLKVTFFWNKNKNMSMRLLDLCVYCLRTQTRYKNKHKKENLLILCGIKIIAITLLLKLKKSLLNKEKKTGQFLKNKHHRLLSNVLVKNNGSMQEFFFPLLKSACTHLLCVKYYLQNKPSH